MHNLNTVESQDNLCDCNEGKRKTDVLISTIEKCERLQKQLDIAVDCLLTINATKDFEDADALRIAYAFKEIEDLDR